MDQAGSETAGVGEAMTMTPEQRLRAVEDVVGGLQAWKGKRVSMAESLSRVKTAGHDRHSATRSGFSMVVENVSVTFSGQTLRVSGAAKGDQYEVAFDSVISVTVNGREIALVEQLGSEVERVSVITLVSGESAPA